MIFEDRGGFVMKFVLGDWPRAAITIMVCFWLPFLIGCAENGTVLTDIDNDSADNPSDSEHSSGDWDQVENDSAELADVDLLDVELEPELESDPEADLPCVPCAGSSPLRCEAGSRAESCVQVNCENGCEVKTRGTPSGFYGYCTGEGNKLCIVCDTKKDGLYSNCSSGLDGDVDLDMENVEGYLSEKGQRGHLEAKGDWIVDLKPGERRLSQFGTADGLDPHDINGDWVTWCYGQDGRLFAYQISTNWLEELKIEGVQPICRYATVDNGKIYAGTLSRDSDSERDIYEIDMTTRHWRRLDSITDSSSFVDQLFARHGHLTSVPYIYGKGDEVALLDVNSGDYSVLTNERYSQRNPKVSDKYLVWENDRTDYYSEIWLYDLTKKEMRSLTPKTQSDSLILGSSMVYGEWATWVSYDEWGGHQAKQYEIFIHYIPTGKTELVPTIGVNVESPWIEGNFLSWTELNPENQYRIRMKKLGSDDAFWVTDTNWKGRQWGAKMSSRWLVYLDYNRFPLPVGFARGYDVVLFDLCTLEQFKNDAMCK